MQYRFLTQNYFSYIPPVIQVCAEENWSILSRAWTSEALPGTLSINSWINLRKYKIKAISIWIKSSVRLWQFEPVIVVNYNALLELPPLPDTGFKLFPTENISNVTVLVLIRLVFPQHVWEGFLHDEREDEWRESTERRGSLWPVRKILSSPS